jgi:hypothetical protein
VAINISITTTTASALKTIAVYLKLSRSPGGYFKALLDPGGRFNSETAERLFYDRSETAFT